MVTNPLTKPGANTRNSVQVTNAEVIGCMAVLWFLEITCESDLIKK
jgi:hypothetical protein